MKALREIKTSEENCIRRVLAVSRESRGIKQKSQRNKSCPHCYCPSVSQCCDYWWYLEISALSLLSKWNIFAENSQQRTESNFVTFGGNFILIFCFLCGFFFCVFFF